MSDKTKKPQSAKIVKFPGKPDRKRRGEQAANTARAAQNDAPFFNFSAITPFARTAVLSYIIAFVPLAVFPDIFHKAEAFMVFGFVPAYFTSGLGNIPWFAPIGVFTHVLLHGGWMHLAFNAVMTLVFGILNERALGARHTALIFFLSAAAGALAQLLWTPFALVPVVGASGAISGLFGSALFILHGQGRLGDRTSSPWKTVAIWAALMTVIGLVTPGNIAWPAHVGGFLAGAWLYSKLPQRRA